MHSAYCILHISLCKVHGDYSTMHCANIMIMWVNKYCAVLKCIDREQWYSLVVEFYQIILKLLKYCMVCMIFAIFVWTFQPKFLSRNKRLRFFRNFFLHNKDNLKLTWIYNSRTSYMNLTIFAPKKKLCTNLPIHTFFFTCVYPIVFREPNNYTNKS